MSKDGGRRIRSPVFRWHSHSCGKVRKYTQHSYETITNLKFLRVKKLHTELIQWRVLKWYPSVHYVPAFWSGTQLSTMCLRSEVVPICSLCPCVLKWYPTVHYVPAFWSGTHLSTMCLRSEVVPICPLRSYIPLTFNSSVDCFMSVLEVFVSESNNTVAYLCTEFHIRRQSTNQSSRKLRVDIRTVFGVDKY
jgi:hypothetical protein